LRIGLLVLLGTSLTCVIYTGSRTAYVAFFAFLLWCWFMSKQKVRWIRYAVLIGILAFFVVPQQYKERFLSIGGEEAVGHSKAARIQTLEDAVIIFLENPTGVGVASFPAVRIERFGRFKDTHNLYLEVATNLGVQGLIIFGILIVTIFRSYKIAYRNYRTQREELAPYLARDDLPDSAREVLQKQADDLKFLMATCVAAASFIFVRLMLGMFGMDLYEIYWWFGSGLAICLHNLSCRTEENNQRILALVG